MLEKNNARLEEKLEKNAANLIHTKKVAIGNQICIFSVFLLALAYFFYRFTNLVQELVHQNNVNL